MAFQPPWKLVAVHDEDVGTVCLSQLCGIIGVAQEPVIVLQQKGGDNIQKLFQLQIVVTPYTPFRQILAVYMGKAYDAVAESGQSILTGISLQRGVEWVNQKLCALTLLPLGKQTGKCDFQNALILPNPDPLHS